MQKFKHKYVFYFYPYWDTLTRKQLPGHFAFFGRVSDGKRIAGIYPGRKYDHQKIF